MLNDFNFINIILYSDWYWHLLASLALWLILYLVEGKLLKRSFAGKTVMLQLLLSNLIDLDHLLSYPIFAAGRCSINNHMLHSYYMFPVYILGVVSSYRYFFMGIAVHLLVDYLGCIL